ncbi:hypothetical protein AOA80_03570 [Methanomassiliicoccales archaeon RumEn M1]|nr:hypothetical protein AOA80_03570 [Methanomassiliicoccales archaeon RumEn M1]
MPVQVGEQVSGVLDPVVLKVVLPLTVVLSDHGHHIRADEVHPYLGRPVTLALGRADEQALLLQVKVPVLCQAQLGRPEAGAEVYRHHALAHRTMPALDILHGLKYFDQIFRVDGPDGLRPS